MDRYTFLGHLTYVINLYKDRLGVRDIIFTMIGDGRDEQTSNPEQALISSSKGMDPIILSPVIGKWTPI